MLAVYLLLDQVVRIQALKGHCCTWPGPVPPLLPPSLLLLLTTGAQGSCYDHPVPAAPEAPGC